MSLKDSIKKTSFKRIFFAVFLIIFIPYSLLYLLGSWPDFFGLHLRSLKSESLYKEQPPNTILLYESDQRTSYDLFQSYVFYAYVSRYFGTNESPERILNFYAELLKNKYGENISPAQIHCGVSNIKQLGNNLGIIEDSVDKYQSNDYASWPSCSIGHKFTKRYLSLNFQARTTDGIVVGPTSRSPIHFGNYKYAYKIQLHYEKK